MLAPEQTLASDSIAAPSGIDHRVLHDEVHRSATHALYMDATRVVLRLSLDGQPFGRSEVATSRSGGKTLESEIKTLEVDPSRLHLGLLVVARDVIVMNPELEEFGGVDSRMIGAAPAIAVHLPGWHHQRITEGVVPRFAFTASDPRWPLWQGINHPDYYKPPAISMPDLTRK